MAETAATSAAGALDGANTVAQVTSPSVGIGGAAGETSGAPSQRNSVVSSMGGAGASFMKSVSVLSATDQVSVRSDWSSTIGGESPPFATQLLDSSSDPFGSLSESYSRSLRSGRHTLTRALSRRPLRYGVHSIQNMRREMEDAHRAVLGLDAAGKEAVAPATGGGGSSGSNATPDTDDPAWAALSTLSYFAVFDGHGGSRAAEFAGQRLCAILAAEAAGTASTSPDSGGDAGTRSPDNTDVHVQALHRAFARTEEEWLELARREDLMDGTTAAVVLLDKARGQCVVGNVGDSEVLVGSRDNTGRRDFRVLTEVHHLKRSPSEASRVEAAGGHIWKGRLGHPKISPHVLSLSVSRALGDLFFKDDKYLDGKASGLIAEPYVMSVEVCGADVAEQFLLIGCDGLWDTVTYSEASSFVFDRLQNDEDPQAISEGLVRLARESGSMDNITVIVVVL